MVGGIPLQPLVPVERYMDRRYREWQRYADHAVIGMEMHEVARHGCRKVGRQDNRRRRGETRNHNGHPTNPA